MFEWLPTLSSIIINTRLNLCSISVFGHPLSSSLGRELLAWQNCWVSTLIEVFAEYQVWIEFSTEHQPPNRGMAGLNVTHHRMILSCSCLSCADVIITGVISVRGHST